MTRGRQLSAALLLRAVEDYGRRLISPPDSAWDDLDLVQASNLMPATFHVVFPLWTEEEGVSDLSLELRLIEAYPGTLETEVTALHVRWGPPCGGGRSTPVNGRCAVKEEG